MNPTIVDASNYEPFRTTIGGKAINLFRLQAIGLPVPDFFCVTSAAFRSFIDLKKHELQPLIERLASTSEIELPDLSRRIHALLAALPFPDLLARELSSRLSGYGGEFFSVRSSAAQEDSAAHSFAGLFRTSLFVRPSEVPDHVFRCWLSPFEPGILGYCRRNGLDPLCLDLGVVIQRMVRSRVSGVMFTADPAGALSDVVVNAGYGLGEGIVSDAVETDTYRYNRVAKSVKSEVVRKQFRIDFDEISGSGTRRLPVPESIATCPALDPETLLALVELGLRAEAGFGDYQDLEWALDQQNRLVLLQSRPITTIPPGDFTLFDNSNIVEGYPGISLPLTFSILKNGYERNFRRLAAALGVPKSILDENRGVFRNMVGYVDGRIYYNLTNWYAIVNLNPVLGRHFIPAFNDMIGAQKSRSADQAHTPFKGWMALVILSTCILFRYVTLGSMMRRYKRQFAEMQQEVQSLDAESMSTHELARAIGRFSGAVFSIIYRPLINDMLLMLQVAITKRLMGRLAVRNPDDLLNSLMCGEQGMESVLPVHSLMQLAELLEANDIRRDASPLLLMEEIQREPKLSRIREAMAEHIRLYGDRCPEELKLETDTFRERPIKLLETALRHVGGVMRVADMEAGEARIRGDAERELAAQLRGRPIAGPLLRLCIRRTRTLLRNREAGRLDRARIFGMFRSLYRLQGRKLAAENTLRSPEDVYYLTEDELSEIVHGSSVFPDVGNLQAAVSQRRSAIDACRARAPAERLLFRGTALRNPVLQARAASHAVDSNVLTGTPCSPGIVDAEAIVVDDPMAAPDVTGRIIVARMTDPGWVFLMIASSGLIVEKGSLLSHTAIIGRELGIPTIVGVQDAAARIHSGQRIRMDASRGEILLQPS